MQHCPQSKKENLVSASRDQELLPKRVGMPENLVRRTIYRDRHDSRCDTRGTDVRSDKTADGRSDNRNVDVRSDHRGADGRNDNRSADGRHGNISQSMKRSASTTLLGDGPAKRTPPVGGSLTNENNGTF